MNITRERRKQICDLSAHLYGGRLNHWQKVINEGEWIGATDENGQKMNYLVQPSIEVIEEYLKMRIRRMDEANIELAELEKELKALKEKEQEARNGEAQSAD